MWKLFFKHKYKCKISHFFSPKGLSNFPASFNASLPLLKFSAVCREERNTVLAYSNQVLGSSQNLHQIMQFVRYTAELICLYSLLARKYINVFFITADISARKRRRWNRPLNIPNYPYYSHRKYQELLNLFSYFQTTDA